MATPRRRGPSASVAEVRDVLRYYPRIYLACHARHVRTASTPHRLSQRDNDILSHLDEKVPVSLSALAKHMGVLRSTMSEAIQRLEALGYVGRSASRDDKRTLALRLSPAGVRAMEAGSVLDPERLERALSTLSAGERRRVLDGLALLADAARRFMTTHSGG